MATTELKSSLDSLGISTAEFAKLIDVTPRAVSLWLAEDREFSGPAAAYLRLFCSLPRIIQAKEIARVRREDPTMYDGMYSFEFQGTQNAGLGALAQDSQATGLGILARQKPNIGLGALVLSDGRVFGSDGGVLYDGSYEPSPSQPGCVDVKLHLTVPPGIPLVQGVGPQPMTYGFDLDCTFSARGTTDLAVLTPYGSVNATITFLRDIPT